MANLEEEFEFPSNGKVYPKPDFATLTLFYGPFQFPSNGKVYPKNLSDAVNYGQGTVSIPFKREGVSKVEIISGICVLFLFVFQFPSNGKVYPKPKGQ